MGAWRGSRGTAAPAVRARRERDGPVVTGVGARRDAGGRAVPMIFQASDIRPAARWDGKVERHPMRRPRAGGARKRDRVAVTVEDRAERPPPRPAAATDTERVGKRMVRERIAPRAAKGAAA